MQSADRTGRYGKVILPALVLRIFRKAINLTEYGPLITMKKGVKE